MNLRPWYIYIYIYILTAHVSLCVGVCQKDHNKIYLVSCDNFFSSSNLIVIVVELSFVGRIVFIVGVKFLGNNNGLG